MEFQKNMQKQQKTRCGNIIHFKNEMKNIKIVIFCKQRMFDNYIQYKIKYHNWRIKLCQYLRFKIKVETQRFKIQHIYPLKQWIVVIFPSLIERSWN